MPTKESECSRTCLFDERTALVWNNGSVTGNNGYYVSPTHMRKPLLPLAQQPPRSRVKIDQSILAATDNCERYLVLHSTA